MGYTVATVDELLADTTGIVPRITLLEIELIPDAGGPSAYLRVSDARYSTTPSDVEHWTFEARLLGGIDYDWSRVSGSAVRGVRSSINRGSIELDNRDRGLHWVADGSYSVGRVRHWAGTYRHYGLPWTTIRDNPIAEYNGRGRPRASGNNVVIEITGAEGLLEDKRLRTKRWLGLGDALSLRPPFGEELIIDGPTYAAALRPTSYLYYSMIFRLADAGSNTPLAVHGNVGQGAWGLRYRSLTGTVQAEINSAGGTPRERVDSTSVLEADRIHQAGIVLALVGGVVQTIGLVLDGVIEASADGTSVAWQSTSTDDITISCNGWITELRWYVDTAPLSASYILDSALRPLGPSEETPPTTHMEVSEGIGTTVYSSIASPTEVEAQLVTSAPAPDWVATLTGEADQAGQVALTAVGEQERMRGYPISRRHRWYAVNGANGDVEPVHGMGPADAGGVDLRIRWGDPKVSTAISFGLAVLNVAGSDIDLRGLRAGQRVSIASTSKVNDGTYTLARDSESDAFAIVGAFTVESAAAAGTVTVTTAGEQLTTGGIEFRAARNLLRVSDLDVAKYFDGFGTALKMTGWADPANNVTLVPTGVEGDALALPAGPVSEPEGREVKLERTITYTGVVTFAFYTSGIHTWSHIRVPSDGSVVPLSGLAVGSELVITGATDPGNNRTFTVTAAGTDSSGPRVAPNVSSPGLDPATVTIKIRERTTQASIDVAPPTIISHDEDLVFAGWQAGGTVTVSGSAANDGAFTIVEATAPEALVVQEALVDEPAGAAVTLDLGDDVRWDLAVYPSRGLAQSATDLSFPLAIAVRGKVWSSGYSAVGADIFRGLAEEHGGLTYPDSFDLELLQAWAAADPHPRGWQWAEDVELAAALDQMVQPLADWGGAIETLKLEVGERPALGPGKTDLDVGPRDHNGLETATQQHTAQPLQPVGYGHNFVPLTQDQIAGIVLEDSPGAVHGLTSEWQYTTDPGSTDESAAPALTTYATRAGARRAAELLAEWFGVDRVLVDAELPYAARCLPLRRTIVQITDPKLPTTAGGQRFAVLSLRVAESTSRLFVSGLLLAIDQGESP